MLPNTGIWQASDELRLNCLVLGDDSDRVFSVEIDNNKNVSMLREAIKDKTKPAFDSTAANRLDLWKVSIKIDDNLPEKLSGRPREKALHPTEILSDLFPNGTPAVNTLHIVVDAPPGTCHTTV
jgi:Crinkler effector protein N-terminal domain